MGEESLPTLLEYWPVFFIGLAIATAAMATGIEGAIFWAPVLLFVYGLPPEVAIACGIFIEVFGFGSGAFYYYRQKRILFREVNGLLMVGILGGIAGAIFSKQAPAAVLYGLLGTGTLFLSVENILRLTHKLKATTVDPGRKNLAHTRLGLALNGIGGFFTGAIGVGLGEVNNWYFIRKNRLPIPYATGNSVYIIAIASFVCSVFNVWYYSIEMPGEELGRLGRILFFALPAVVIGARWGGRLAHRTEPELFYGVAAALFLFVATQSFYRMFQ